MPAAHLTERDSRILDAYFLGQRDLPALAARCGLSHDELQAWLARPEIQAALEHLDRITAVTRRLRAFDDQMAALDALGDVCRNSPCLVERRRAAMAILSGRWMHPPRPPRPRAARPARPARARPAHSAPRADRSPPASTTPPDSPSPPRVEVPPPPRVEVPPPEPPSALNPAIQVTASSSPGAPHALPPPLPPRAAFAPPPEPALVFLDTLPVRPAPAATVPWPDAESPGMRRLTTQSPAMKPPSLQSPRTTHSPSGSQVASWPAALSRPRAAHAAPRPLDSG